MATTEDKKDNGITSTNSLGKSFSTIKIYTWLNHPSIMKVKLIFFFSEKTESIYLSEILSKRIIKDVFQEELEFRKSGRL